MAHEVGVVRHPGVLGFAVLGGAAVHWLVPQGGCVERPTSAVPAHGLGRQNNCFAPACGLAGLPFSVVNFPAMEAPEGCKHVEIDDQQEDGVGEGIISFFGTLKTVQFAQKYGEVFLFRQAQMLRNPLRIGSVERDPQKDKVPVWGVIGLTDAGALLPSKSAAYARIQRLRHVYVRDAEAFF